MTYAREHVRFASAALTKAEVVHEIYLLPGTDHGFDINWGGFAAQIARPKIEAFLQRYGGAVPKDAAPPVWNR